MNRVPIDRIADVGEQPYRKPARCASRKHFQADQSETPTHNLTGQVLRTMLMRVRRQVKRHGLSSAGPQQMTTR
jgi:hypothetical protein